MPRKREGARVLGPYQEGDRWRIITIERGRREAHFADDWESAMRLLGRLRRKVIRNERTVGDLLVEYREHRRKIALALPQTIENNDYRLRKFLEAFLEGPAADLTPSRAAELYARHVETPGARGRLPAAATHRFDLRLARIFTRWAVKAGRLEEDPFAQVQPVGRPRQGKLQLRIDEARKFSDAAVSAFEERGDQLALAALCCLWMGLRASEALRRQVRDLDDGGRVLWIPGGKTENARRRLVVPEVLQPLLLRLAAGRPGDAPLFDESGDGRGFRRTSLTRTVGKLCARIGVPVVCAHSLRGLHASLALGAGATADAVASALGHSSFAVTQRHYAQPDAVQGAATSRVAGILGSTDSGSTELLRGLDEGTLRELLALLEERKRGR